MRENQFQTKLISEIKALLPGCMVLKNDPNYISGIPDLTVLYKNYWAYLEVKKSEDEPFQPNQEYYIDWARRTNGYGFVVHPKNKSDILYTLKTLWK